MVFASSNPVLFNLATLDLGKFRKPGWALRGGLEQTAQISQSGKAET